MKGVKLGEARPLRILTLDFECLPGHWIGSDYVSRVVTALAWSWSDDPERIDVLTHYDASRMFMADRFASLVEQADIVTGHWITGFDLPVGNGALLRENLAPVKQVLASDTKTQLSKTSGRSLSQQNLAASLGVEAPKVNVTLRQWEEFNLREPWARDIGVERVVSDVRQHQQMRAALIERGWLGAPAMWRPNVRVSGYGRYHA